MKRNDNRSERMTAYGPPHDDSKGISFCLLKNGMLTVSVQGRGSFTMEPDDVVDLVEFLNPTPDTMGR